MDDAGSDLIRSELIERGVDRLDGALHVALDDEKELLLTALAGLLHHLFERAGAGACGPDVAQLADAVLGQLAGAGFVLNHGQLIACVGCAIEAKHLDGSRWTGCDDVLALVVDKRAHTAPGAPSHDELANLEGAALNEDRADRATAALKFRLDDDAFRRPVRIGAEFQNLRL